MLRRCVRLLGEFALLFGQLLQAVFEIFQLCDLLPALFDRLELVLQSLLGLFEGLQSLLLLGLRLMWLVGLQLLLGVRHRLGRLLQRLLELRIGGQRGVAQLLGVVENILLQFAGQGEPFGVILGPFGFGLSLLLLLDELLEAFGSLLQGGVWVTLCLLCLGEVAFDFLAGLLELVQSLLLLFACLLQLSAAECIFGFPLEIFDRLEFFGDF